ncbi:MAG: hypothetical protein H0S85_05340 [Desulfovibrionaceae bacterium]|jgi:hypothetical protein|nr:hypothetical protein [Desulfovibrionaceae bacterium]
MSTSTVIILVAVYALLLAAYYVVMKFQRAGRWYGLSQSDSLQFMKREMEEKGYDTKAIDFWVEQEMMMMEQHRRRLEDQAIKHDTLFFMCWIMTLITFILLLS